MKRTIAIILILMMVPALFTFQCDAVSSTNVLCYSEDYFSGDYNHVISIKSHFSAAGLTTAVISRPTVIYGVTYNLSNFYTLYFSSHGTSLGSVLVLDSGTQYSPSNLPGTITSEFVFYSACYSAKTNTSLNLNLCSQTVSNGATAVIGYTDSVGVNASRCLELNFYDLAISDVSAAYIPVYWALSQAKTVAASVYGTSDSAVTSSVMYGNGGFHF